MASTSGAEAPQQLFVRKASGVVRLGTPWRMFAFNIGFSGLTYVAMAYGFTPAVFPGANLIVGIIAATIGMAFLGILYAFFSTAMPRSGGDYVFVSRTLGSWIGFTINFVEAMCYAFWIAWGAYWLSYMVLSGSFSVLGSITGNSTLTDVGSALATNNWSFVVGTVTIVLMGLVVGFGMQRYYRFQTISFVLGMLGMLAVIVVFLVKSTSDFVTGFNKYADSVVSLPDAYHTIISRAEGLGFPASPAFSWTATLGIFGIIWLLGVGTSYISGEVKTVKKSQFIGIVGGSLGTSLIVLIVAIVMLKTVGSHFNAAANYLSLNDPANYPLPVPPYYNLWASILANSPYLICLIGLGFVVWGYYWLPQNIIIISRMMLAWSMDRIMPEKLGDVHRSFHVPHVAIIVTCVLAEVFLCFYTFTPWFLALAPMLPLCFVFIVVGFAGIVFPFLKRTRPIYKASGVDYEILGIPVFSIAGAVTIVYWAIALYYALSYPALGLTSAGAIIFAVTIFVLGPVLYGIAKLIRRRQGLDVAAAFKVLPPE